jgi:hypothetical protein
MSSAALKMQRRESLTEPCSEAMTQAALKELKKESVYTQTLLQTPPKDPWDWCTALAKADYTQQTLSCCSSETILTTPTKIYADKSIYR